MIKATTKINILFLGGAKRVSLAEHFISEGEKMGMEINMFSYELEKNVPVACVATVITGLLWKDDHVYDHLSEIIRNHSINIILPFLDPAIETASRLKEMFPSVFIPCCEIELCQIMFDKQTSNEWFRKNDIPVPDSYSANNMSGIKFPVIMKPRTGSASKGIKVVHNSSELEKVKNPSSYLIQKHIANNREYTADCYVSQNGLNLCIVPRIRIETSGGEVTRTLTIKNEKIMEMSKKILSKAVFRGPVTIQFIENMDDGMIYVMEINPRLGGGVIACIEAGANIPAFIIKECMNIPVVPTDNWKEDTLMVRYFKEIIFHADNH